MTTEKHPHLHLFNFSTKWKYLIIGTFPPNTALREKMYIDYFYGNKGFLWKIIHDIYCDRGYNFFIGSMQENLSEIQRWQKDYCVGLSDTIEQCSRRHPLSSDDSDLIDIKYNYNLRDYVLSNIDHLEKIIFTSSYGKNSAFENFRIIMGKEISVVSGKLVTGLPSPSGASNITFFNTNEEKSLGLTEDFFHYVQNQHPHLLEFFEYRWQLKKRRRESQDKQDVIVPSTPKGLVKEFKLWRYRQVLPSERC